MRCGAILIDYIILVAIVAFSTLIARMLGGGARAAGNSAETVGIVIAIVVAVLEPGSASRFDRTDARQVGHWAADCSEAMDGTSDRARLLAPLCRLSAFVSDSWAWISDGRADAAWARLHDLIAGTIVVRGRLMAVATESVQVVTNADLRFEI